MAASAVVGHLRDGRGTLPGVPTKYPRSQITRGPRVERLVRIGQPRWPDSSPGDVLVNLAEERADQMAHGAGSDDPLAGLVTVPSRGRRVTRQMVEDALDEV